MKNNEAPFKIKFQKIVLVQLALICILFACKKKGVDFVPDCSGAPKSFTTDVSPIIQASCAVNSGCHGAGSRNGVGELLTFTKIFNVRSDIRSEVASGEMPLNGSLTNTEKNAILCWIDGGAPNN
jgi:hypothetical protein